MPENKELKVEFKPLTKDNWEDLEKLFGKNGAFCGCWCMYWRISSKEFKANQGEGNRLMFKKSLNRERSLALSHMLMEFLQDGLLFPHEKNSQLLKIQNN